MKRNRSRAEKRLDWLVIAGTIAFLAIIFACIAWC